MLDRKEIDKIKEKVKLSRRLGIESDVLPSSPLGVATVLGLRHQGVIVGLGEKDQLPKGANWIYGTTDFANPVEAIMPAMAASGMEPNKVIYTTDPSAHTIRSYLDRILVPSLISHYGLNLEETERLNGQVQKLPKVHNPYLDNLANLTADLSSTHFRDYIQNIMGVVGTYQSFTELYGAMNETLAKKLGLTYQTETQFYKDANLTIGDLSNGAKEIEQAVAEHEQPLRGKIHSTIDQALDEIGVQRPMGQADRDQIKREMTRELYKFVLGGESLWGAENRRFMRRNHGDENFVNMDSLDPNLKLYQLKDQGITLGGNGWIVLMQLLEKNSDRETVIAHKATRLGANYATPLLAARRTRVCVSPIVRVVPGSQNALTGDGLDIGVYTLYPDLITKVQQAFELKTPDFLGGKKKVVIEVTGTPPQVAVFTEPSDNNGQAARKLINL